MLDRDTDIILLNGDVTLFHDNGLSFQTDSATINMKDKTAEGSAPVEGQNGDGELFSEGFRVRDDGDTIVFTGKAYMKIYPKQKNQGSSVPAQQGTGQEGQGGHVGREVDRLDPSANWASGLNLVGCARRRRLDLVGSRSWTRTRPIAAALPTSWSH